MRKWRCTVCGYIHLGAEPPEVCPVCSAGREAFVDEGPAEAAGALPVEIRREVKPVLFRISYGLFVIGTRDGSRRLNGSTINTFIATGGQAHLRSAPPGGQRLPGPDAVPRVPRGLPAPQGRSLTPAAIRSLWPRSRTAA